MTTARILVVDDTKDLRELYSLWLCRAGYQVLEAASGKECLELINSEFIDLVVLDVMLTDLSGIEVCKKIKAQAPSLPVINISGRLTSSDNEAEGLEAGADGYLTKPFQERTLLAHIKALLRIRQTEAALQSSEKRFSAAFDNALDAMVVVDDDGNYLDANPSACALFGIAKAEMLKRNMSEFVEPAHEPEVLQLWRGFIEAGEQAGEFRLRRPDGTGRLLEYRAKANILPHRHFSVLRDITERKRTDEQLRQAHDELEQRVEQRTAELVAANTFLRAEISDRKNAEEALKQAEEKYRSIVENAISGIFQSTPDGRFISANQALARIFGYDSPEELMEQRRNIELEHYVNPAHRAEFKRLLDEDGVVKNFELQAYRKDGSTIWTTENCRVVRDQSGEVMYYEGIVDDITVDKKLEETRQLLSSIVESSSDGIVSFTVDGKVLSWNAAAEKLFGYSAEEVQGHDVSLFLSPETSRESLPIFKVVQAGEPVVFEAQRRRRDGTLIDVSITTCPIKNRQGDVIGVSSNVRDISEARRAAEMRTQLLKRLVTAQEDERRRISRELHDQMGQSLAALMLGLKSLEGSAQLESSASRRLKDLQELTNSLAEEVHTLARHLRPTALDDFGLHTALSNYVDDWSERSEINADFHSNGLITRRLPPDIETAVYRMVQEALTNVLKHARARNVSVIVEHRGGRVLAIVEDDGCGFDVTTPSVLSPKQRRLGVLGMEERISLVGGTFNIESTPGLGTTVLATIPVSEPNGGDKE